MNLEILLSEQGTEPLDDSVNGAPLRAFINGRLKRLGIEAITKDTPSDKILETIYGIEDADVQTQLLNRPVSEIKGSLNYRRVMAYSAVIFTILILSFFVMVVKGDNQLTPEEVDMIKTLGSGAINAISTMFTQ